MWGGAAISQNPLQHKRVDLASFYKSKEDLLKDYLELRMDGSAIFATYRRDFLLKHNIYFTKHFHEDIYFMFLVYYHASNLHIIDSPIYIKRDRPSSITHSISKKHIDGFLLAYRKILEYIRDDSMYLNSYNKGLVALSAILLRNIHRYGDAYKMDLNSYLFESIKDFSLDTSGFDIETKYLKLYKALLDSNGEFNDAFDSKISSILRSSWSCYDLHNSLFLASKEIRACCKRFFVNGVEKGDVVLCNIKSNGKDLLSQILESKQDLFKRINSSLAQECYGCPHLEFKEWDLLDRLKVEKVSFEYHSVCNLRCIYCSPKYYGGERPSYAIGEFINNLIDSKALESCKSIVWAGGEPSLDKDFDSSIKALSKYVDFKQVVITNAIKYSKTLQDLLDNNKAKITTSIDSGTESTFKKVRGSSGLATVFKNLAMYSRVNPRSVTIKYIVLSNNSSREELLSFVNLIEDYGLINCNFHLSCNFHESSISLELLALVCLLFAFLRKKGAQVVFFDELLRERIFCSSLDLDYIKKILSKDDLESFLEDSNAYQKLCIWGYNTNTKLLLKKSIFLQNIKDIRIIDSDHIGTKIIKHGNIIQVENPLDFLESNYQIFISAVQGSPRIYEEFISSGFNLNRLVLGLVL